MTPATLARHVRERFVRASGPGGQNVNKVATAVELRFDIHGSPLPADARRRLIDLAGARVTQDGILIIDSREHRTQARNRAEAWARFAALVTRALQRPRVRRPTSPGTGARQRRLSDKKLRGGVKARRGRRGDHDE